MKEKVNPRTNSARSQEAALRKEKLMSKSRSLAVAENKLRLYEQGGVNSAHLVEAQRIKVEEMRAAEAANQRGGGAGNVVQFNQPITTNQTKQAAVALPTRNQDSSVWSYVSSLWD